ncbi:MAG: phospho-N-acetylmuramoyl-pentapeptide-transferase [Spirochaetes bacterium]|nr:phospho-N-acetylmuramoyl-pentapeptide-transferase [Spirochaetota bacterium]
MALEFIYPLVIYFTPFNVFSYLTFRTAYAAITTMFLCFIFGPKIIEGLRRLKVGQSIRADGPDTHLVKSGTPTMGGIFIILSVVLSMLFWGNLRSPMVVLTLASFVAFGALGFLDDYLKLRRRNSDGLTAFGKLLGQFAIASVVVIYLYRNGGEGITYLYVPFVWDPVFDMGRAWIPFGILLVVGSSNAVNLTDGLDGLAAGLLILVFGTLAILAYITGRVDFSEFLGIPFIPGAGELTVFSLAVVGACVGFLWFNSHPAEVFMGDVGSLSLGGVIAVLSLIIKKEVLIFIIGGVFVLEIASVVIQVVSFKLRGKRVFKMTPIHHHFEKSGWPESKVVIRFWILGGLFAIIALSTLKIQ